jgi:hypothetical protein
MKKRSLRYECAVYLLVRHKQNATGDINDQLLRTAEGHTRKYDAPCVRLKVSSQVMSKNAVGGK